MPRSKVYVKKPIRRYERAFGEEQRSEGETEQKAEEQAPPVIPDITSPAGINPPVIGLKKRAALNTARLVPERGEKRNEKTGEKESQARGNER